MSSPPTDPARDGAPGADSTAPAHDGASRRRRPAGPTAARLAARVRIPVVVLGVAGVIAGALTGVGALVAAGIVAWLVGVALYLRIGTVRAAPEPVRLPVRGRWWALNSPADRVPSHGLHAYGQTYAIDVLAVPEGDWTPKVGPSPATRPPDAYPAFGEPVVAPVDGVVVRVRDGAPDHRSRASWPGVLWFYVEATVRELGGPGRLLGNHVVIEVRPGVHALVAHLQQGSAAVRPGDRVAAGDPIAACGNSGSSTEPHVHFQLMDRPGPLFAAGLPFVLVGATDDDGAPVDVPRTGTAVHG